LGYGNEETVWLQNLLESKGEEARKKQTKEAMGVTAADQQDAPSSEDKVNSTEVVGLPQNGSGDDATKENEAAIWKLDMFCRAVFQQDGLEYEGIVKSIENSDDGQYAVVQFVGYGNEETLWLKDLLESKGEEARQKQTKEAMGTTAVDEPDAPSSEGKVNSTEVVGLPQKGSGDDATKKNEAAIWKLGMFCRGIFNDGVEYEGIVKSIENSEDGQYVAVKIIGYDTQETIWLENLLKSNGEEARQKQFRESKAKKEKTIPSEKVKINPTEVNGVPQNKSSEVKLDPTEIISATQNSPNITSPAVTEIVSAAQNSPNITSGSINHGLVNGDKNNNLPSGNGVQNVGASGVTVNLQQKYEEQSAQIEELTRVNKVLMTTLNNVEQEMLMYAHVIGEMKSLMKASLGESPSVEPGNGLANGHI